MFPLPEMIIAVLAQFAGLFSATVWGHAQVLVIGAILCQGPRTKDFGTSADANECLLFPKAAWDAVLDQLAATA